MDGHRLGGILCLLPHSFPSTTTPKTGAAVAAATQVSEISSALGSARHCATRLLPQDLFQPYPYPAVTRRTPTIFFSAGEPEVWAR